MGVGAVPRTAIVGATQCVAIAAALTLALAATPVDAQVYRWTDADGRVHYSDKPPPAAVDAETVPIRTQPTDLKATLDDAAERARALEAAERQREEIAADEAAEAEYRARVERACTQARERVGSIERARRLSRDGRTYTDDERAAALAEARAQVGEWCR